MPLTGKAQLAAAQLDDLGSNDRGDKVLLSNTAQVLVDMAGYLISQAQINLNKSGAEATGELEASIKAGDIDVSGKRMSIDISLLDRYRFTDAGVNGTEQGVRTGESPYTFRSSKPNKKMATAILKWVRRRGMRATKYKPISKTEKKDQGIRKTRDEATDLKGLAYAISTNIKKKGIKPTKFFTKALASTEKEFRKQIAAGYKLDIINNLK